MKYIGIDISKDSLSVAIPNEEVGGYTLLTVKNNPTDIAKFIKARCGADTHCVMEATGNYGMLLVYLLSKAGVTLSLENPKKVKNFARALLQVTKTDSIDARLLSRYGEAMRPEPYRMKSEELLLLQQKRTVLRMLRKQLTATRNVLEAIDVLPVKDRFSQQAVRKTIRFLERQIEDTKKEISDLTEEKYNHLMKLLTSVKGIGVEIAAAVILATGGFTLFDNAKQFSRFVGLCPTYAQSGTSVHSRGHINKNGDPHLRALLYMASCSAVRCNEACRETQIRMKNRGKPGKVVQIAVANKLVRQMFAVAKNDTVFVNGFVSEPPKTTKNQLCIEQS